MLSSADVARRLTLIAKWDKWQFVVKTWCQVHLVAAAHSLCWLANYLKSSVSFWTTLILHKTANSDYPNCCSALEKMCDFAAKRQSEFQQQTSREDLLYRKWEVPYLCSLQCNLSMHSIIILQLCNSILWHSKTMLYTKYVLIHCVYHTKYVVTWVWYVPYSVH